MMEISRWPPFAKICKINFDFILSGKARRNKVQCLLSQNFAKINFAVQCRDGNFGYQELVLV